MNFDNMGISGTDVLDAVVQMEKRCTTGLQPQVIEALLHGLGHDDAFRALFAQDPRAALGTIGHESSPATLGVVGVDPVMCLNGTNLASKESIQAASEKLRRELTIFMPFACPAV